MADFSVDCDIKGEKRQLLGRRADFDVYAYQRHGAQGGQFSRKRIIPKSYPVQRFVWDHRKDISRLPKVIMGGSPSPAERQLHPLRISIDCGSSKRSLSDFRAQPTGMSGPYRKWIQDVKLRAVGPPPIAQYQKVQPLRILGAIQERVSRVMRGR